MHAYIYTYIGFDMDELRSSNEYLGALLYVSFLFIAFFVMLNMFLAIIARAYDESGVYGLGFKPLTLNPYPKT